MKIRLFKKIKVKIFNIKIKKLKNEQLKSGDRKPT